VRVFPRSGKSLTERKNPSSAMAVTKPCLDWAITMEEPLP